MFDNNYNLFIFRQRILPVQPLSWEKNREILVNCSFCHGGPSSHPLQQHQEGGARLHQDRFFWWLEVLKD